MKETVLGSKLLIDCSSWKMGAYNLLKMDRRLNTFYRKECPGKQAYWLTLRALDTSLAQRILFWST
jgi:phage protein U